MEADEERTRRWGKSMSVIMQFGRALADLQISFICAHSPAAKGRVKRTHFRNVIERPLEGKCATDCNWPRLRIRGRAGKLPFGDRARPTAVLTHGKRFDLAEVHLRWPST